VRVFRMSSTALLLGVALPLLVAPAASAQTPGGARNAGVTSVSVTCSGDTVYASAVVRGGANARPVTVALLARQGGASSYAPTGKTHVLGAKPGRNTWTFNVADIARSSSSFRAAVTTGRDTVQSNSLSTSACAPGTEVPEAPVALLVPLTLAATAGGVLAARSRRNTGLQTA
jgi:hypothetical protein